MRRRDREILIAILLVEMAARPVAARMFEWLITFFGRSLFVPARWLPSTLGPFQMRDAPFGFEAAARCAVERIADKPSDVNSLARYWHGAALRERGARVGYADALETAMRMARHMNQANGARTVQPP